MEHPKLELQLIRNLTSNSYPPNQMSIILITISRVTTILLYMKMQKETTFTYNILMISIQTKWNSILSIETAITSIKSKAIIKR